MNENRFKHLNLTWRYHIAAHILLWNVEYDRYGDEIVVRDWNDNDSSKI